MSDTVISGLDSSIYCITGSKEEIPLLLGAREFVRGALLSRAGEASMSIGDRPSLIRRLGAW